MLPSKSTPSIAKRIQESIREHRLATHPQKILVAVSGGPDSVCLLHSLYDLRHEFKIDLQVAHLNHQLRGAESEADAAYVAKTAAQLSLPAIIEARDVEAYRADHGLSLEEAAREVRYCFLAEIARSRECEAVAVGHTLNDHLETILLHIIRGSGTRGLRGLQPCQMLHFAGYDLKVIRPMLEIGREETLEFCSSRGLNPREDSSNLDFSPLRNRVRSELIPLLKGYNPGISESLLRLGRIAQDEGAFLEMESSRIWEEMIVQEGKSLIFPKAQFKSLQPAMQRLLLRTAIKRLLGSLKDIETRHLEKIMEALAKPAGKRIVLPLGLIFIIGYERFVLEFVDKALTFPKLPESFSLKVPGKAEIEGWKIAAEVVSPLSVNFSEEPIMGSEPKGNQTNFSALLDYHRIGDRIIMRARSKGDWFQPLGMAEPKKVNKFMMDARIPRDWRDQIPIICSPDQIVWIVGWRIDERVKVTPSTRQVLRVTLERMRSEQL